MIFENLKSGIEVGDEELHQIYPEHLRGDADIHFTPIETAQMAARYLVQEAGTKVLDIGSGVGKFCMVGAACTAGHFTGIELRESLFSISSRVLQQYPLPNLQFIHSNITAIDFKQYDAFYFFNAFYENIHPGDSIDQSVLMQQELYARYSEYVRGQLDAKPTGTRLATFFSFMDEVPDSYLMQSAGSEGKLLLWEKMD